jgi:putative spermidine/putrescine transport system permease protein
LNRADRRRLLLRLLPLVVFFALTVGVGLVHAVLQSLALAGPPALNSHHRDMGIWYAYRALFMRPELLASLGHTLYVALVSATVSVMVGAIGAYLLWRAPGWVRRAGTVYRLPIILPHIVVAFLTMLLWSRSGIIASVSHHLGITSGSNEFPRVLYSSNGVGMILAYVYKEFPFVMLLSLGVLDRVPKRMVTTAYMLGAGPVRTFLTVVLPLMAPMLNQIFIILFLYTLGGFDIPWLLGGSNPQMVPMTVYSLYFQGSLSDRSIAMAALSLIAGLAMVFVVIYSRIARRLAAWERPV